MDKLDRYRAIIRQVFDEWVRWPRKEAGFVVEPVIDTENDRYIIAAVGWQDNRRVYDTLAHIDIIGDKLWIQRNNTESAIATELAEAGIPKSDIVLGYFSPEHRRESTDFAVG